ncbi:phage tail tip lysozyme [uncultured Megasphaera sp.]|uniref:phage tail tip lysozyme n=1 Tax=uncultured Megasphaera sp. TaxID=165188 RepID=UPI002597FE15|nr:phage tail tip lysozyme [uncultured Megasphaera sp.]
MQDATGKLLPLNVQLERLAEGYKKAREAGQGQEYIMATLGVRGMALTKTLLEYDEAARRTASLKGIGIDPKAMHEASEDVKVMQMQLQQITLTAGAALSPLVASLARDLLPLLSDTAAWLGKHKELVGSVTVSVVRLVAAYEALKLARNAATAVRDIYDKLKPRTTAADMERMEALTRAQERQIARSINASNKRYDVQRQLAIKTAKDEQMSAAETERYLTESFTRIGIAAERSANSIRESMTAAFRMANREATQAATGMTGANVRVAESELAIGKAAQTSAALKAQATARSVAASKAAAAANVRTAATEAAVGREAQATGVAYTFAGTKAVSASTVSIGAVSRVGGMVRNLTGMVWALAGGWMGVAAAAVAAGAYMYSAYKKDQAYRGAHTYSVKGADGQTHRMTVGEDGTVLRANDDKAYARKYKVGHVSVYKPIDDTAIQNARKAHAARLAQVKAEEDRKMRLDIDKQIRELGGISDMQLPKTRAGRGAGSDKANAAPKDTSIAAQVYQILTKSGVDSRYAIGLVGSYMMESGGNTERLRAGAVNPKSGAYGIGQWLGTRKRALAAFAQSRGLSMSDYRTQALFQAHELLSNGYERGQYLKALSQIRAQGITDPGQLAILADRYTTRSEQTGAIKAQKARNARAFAARIKGGVGSGADMDLAGDVAEHQLAIDKARQDLHNLELELSAAVQRDTGTAYEVGMAQVREEVRRKKAQIDSLAQTDPSIDTAKAAKLLAAYQEAETAKVTAAWRKRWQEFTAAANRAETELTGDYKRAADNDFKDKIARLDAERKEQLKALAQHANDKAAELAVDKAYTVKRLALMRELDDARRDSYKRELDYAASRHDMTHVRSLLSGRRREQYDAWQDEGKAVQTYIKLCQDGTVTTQGMMAGIAESFSGTLADSFGKLGSEIHNTAELVESVGKTMLHTIMQVMAKMVAAKAAAAIFGGVLGSQNPTYRMADYLPGKAPGGIGGGLLQSFMPHFATGGVVTAPTIGLIGEGGDREAVLPLNAQTFAALGEGVARNLSRGGGSAAPIINVINKSGSPATVTSAGVDDKMGAAVYTVVIDKLMANKDGALDALRQQVGGQQ